MAKSPEAETPKPKSKSAGIAGWILMAMLILGLGGFGVTNFGGGLTSIGRVGDTKISVDDYALAFRQQLNAFSQQVGQQISAQEAIAFGLDRQVLQSLITRTALDNEAHRVGLSVGDAVVAAELTGMDAFKGASGGFDREAYRFTLERNKLSEAEFETNIRRDLSRALLQGAISGGFAAPEAMTGTIYAWVAERRGFSMLRLTEADLTAPVPEPTDAELQAYHLANIAQFTKPEAKRITYAALLPEMIAKDQPVDEAVLKKLYDDRIDEFVVPERRLVERLVYPDQAAADAAGKRLDTGETFETLVADRGLTLDSIDLGDVSKDDLGPAGEAVFSLTEPGTIGPLMSDLGPAIFRVNAILQAEETTFEDAREALAIEIQTDAARRTIADQVEVVDDLLAGGGSLEDLKTDAGMKLETLDYVPGAPGDSTIEGYPAFRAAAEAVAEGDFPEAVVLDDGGMVALRLDEIVPSAPIPFDEAKAAVATAWRAAAVAKSLSDRAIEIKTAIEGGAAIGSFGIVDVTSEIARDGFVEATPEDLLKGVFQMAEGDVRVFDAQGFVGVVRLDTILPAATEREDATAMTAALAAQIEQAIAQDAFNAFTTALTAEAGIAIDQSAINAVHASLQ
ncbi:SurA N-terminal domain-containing protein [Tabrizicola sp.]|uniref:peptidylprolyl isomerase n=1 Tax=Tabrizicola sp. TaxID=2005166 RepID=UPI00286C2E60|nr:SurA N-terminal domain-containing protein [Tabrizicola sp.]